MRKRIINIMLITSILFAIAACGKTEEKSKDTEKNKAETERTTENTEETTEGKSSSEEIYGAAIDAYTEAYKSKFKNIDGKYLADGKSQLVYMDSKYRLCYAFADIDGNGTDEFFVGAGNDDNMTIYDAWSYDGKEIVRLFPEIVFGYKNMCFVCDKGVLEICRKDGKNHTGIDFYTMAENGYTVELLESIATKGRNKNMKYYHQNEEITEDEFNDIKAAHQRVELKWTAVEGNEEQNK